uniref:Uncharacterized protein n=1 Tax=Lotharella oceanica TaxID=641309 RepID=A0A7S2U1A5_9EUKA|mmetsp:Transcript_5723/g.11345  ORF Transcript_5723/g.11345 Transcript_5723/m.11345 type:complete len:287 (+) Transcript_5723:333-1193(+)
MDTNSMFGADKSFATIATEDTGGAQKDQGTRSAFEVGVLDDLIMTDDNGDGASQHAKAVDILAAEFKKVMNDFGLDAGGIEAAVQAALSKVMSARKTTAESSVEANGKLVAPKMPENLFGSENQDFSPQFPTAAAPAPQPSSMGPDSKSMGGVFNKMPNPGPSNPQFGASPFPGTMQQAPVSQRLPAPTVQSNVQPADQQASTDQMRNPFDDDNYDPSFDPSQPNPFEMADGRAFTQTRAQTTTPGFTQPPQQSSQATVQQQAPDVQKQPSKDDLFAFADPFKSMG